MRIKNIIMPFICCGMLLSSFQFGNCRALSLYEEYSCYFEEKDSENIVISKTNEKDKEILKNMIVGEGKEFARYLGYGAEVADIDELLTTSQNEFSLTIKNPSNDVVGQILIGKSNNENQLSVSYWIGKNFRGNGYAHLAISKAMSIIWKANNNISFEFEIDDENISSIKTVKKVCKNLNIDFNNPDSHRFTKRESHTVEIKALKNDGQSSTYDIQFYVDNILIDNVVKTKQDILKKYSQDKLDSGVLLKNSSSIYVIRYSD